jgi:hypothetical protein
MGSFVKACFLVLAVLLEASPGLAQVPERFRGEFDGDSARRRAQPQFAEDFARSQAIMEARFYHPRFGYRRRGDFWRSGEFDRLIGRRR